MSPPSYEAQLLLAALASKPRCVTTRLALADALEEAGVPADVCEWIRGPVFVHTLWYTGFGFTSLVVCSDEFRTVHSTRISFDFAPRE